MAIRGIDAIQNVEFDDDLYQGPELVTPIGIAIAADKSPIQYLSVTVNGQPIRLFDMEQTNISDCLLTAGIKLKKSIRKTRNGKNRSLQWPANHDSWSTWDYAKN